MSVKSRPQYNQNITKTTSGIIIKSCAKCGKKWDDSGICECGAVRSVNCAACAWSVYLVKDGPRSNPYRKVSARNQYARLYCYYSDKWNQPSPKGIRFWSKNEIILVDSNYTCNLWTSKNWRAEAIKIQGVRTIPTAVKRAVWTRDKGKCVVCGSRKNLEYDHIIPVSRGGSNTERNIQLLCSLCNKKKSDNII
jgi:5-methylcytosine-specific restriction endonuclease McrA